MIVYVRSSDALYLGSEGACTLDDGAWLANYGSIDWFGNDDLTLADGAYITNDGSQQEGIFAIHNGQSIKDTTNWGGGFVGPAPCFQLINGATLLKAGGAETTMEVRLDNIDSTLNLLGNALHLKNIDYSPNNALTRIGLGGTLTIDANVSQIGDQSETYLDGGVLVASNISVASGLLDLGGGTVSALINNNVNGLMSAVLGQNQWPRYY